MPEATQITGRLFIDGLPAAGQEITLISPQFDAFLGRAMTGSGGDFALFLQQSGLNGAGLLIKIRHPFIALAYRQVEVPLTAPVEIDLDSGAGVWTLSGEIEPFAGRAPHLNLFLDPLSTPEVPAGSARFINQVEPFVHDAHFYVLQVAGEQFSIRVKAGRYAIGGAYLNYDRPNIVDPDFDNLIVHRAELAGSPAPLPGTPYGGFEIDVEGDCHLLLSLIAVDDDEL